MDRKVIFAVVALAVAASILLIFSIRPESGPAIEPIAKPAEAAGPICPGCNIVLISVETTRADHLPCYGYGRDTMPFTCSLAAEGALFEKAYASRSDTWPSLTSMLTSEYPASTGVRDNGELLTEGVPTLPSILSGRGYLTASFLTNYCEAGAYGFNVSYCTPYSEYGGNDANLTAEAIAWLGANGGGKFFLWMHYFAPHSPYYAIGGHDAFTEGNYAGGYDGGRAQLDNATLGLLDVSQADVDHVVGLYDGRLAFDDSQIRTVYGALDRLGLLNRTIVVITADHGEELYQRNRYFYHDCSIYDSTLHIPLIIKTPYGQGGLRVPGLVGNIDIAPTLLDLVNVPKPGKFEGRTLVPLLANGTGSGFDTALSERYSRGNVSGILSIRTGGWRYVYNPMNVTPHCLPEGDYYRVKTEELYDEASDPMELNDVASSHPEVTSQLKDELLSRYPNASASEAAVADEAALERLRSLGYLA